MKVTDSFVNGILKEMGCEPEKPARWKPHYYISRIFGRREDGWICSKCGKHSYVKRSVCDGCNSQMPMESEGTK